MLNHTPSHLSLFIRLSHSTSPPRARSHFSSSLNPTFVNMCSNMSSETSINNLRSCYPVVPSGSDPTTNDDDRLPFTQLHPHTSNIQNTFSFSDIIVPTDMATTLSVISNCTTTTATTLNATINNTAAAKNDIGLFSSAANDATPSSAMAALVHGPPPGYTPPSFTQPPHILHHQHLHHHAHPVLTATPLYPPAYTIPDPAPAQSPVPDITATHRLGEHCHCATWILEPKKRAVPVTSSHQHAVQLHASTNTTDLTNMTLHLPLTTTTTTSNVLETEVLTTAQPQQSYDDRSNAIPPFSTIPLTRPLPSSMEIPLAEPGVQHIDVNHTIGSNLDVSMDDNIGTNTVAPLFSLLPEPVPEPGCNRPLSSFLEFREGCCSYTQQHQKLHLQQRQPQQKQTLDTMQTQNQTNQKELRNQQVCNVEYDSFAAQHDRVDRSELLCFNREFQKPHLQMKSGSGSLLNINVATSHVRHGHYCRGVDVGVDSATGRIDDTFGSGVSNSILNPVQTSLSHAAQSSPNLFSFSLPTAQQASHSYLLEPQPHHLEPPQQQTDLTAPPGFPALPATHDKVLQQDQPTSPLQNQHKKMSCPSAFPSLPVFHSHVFQTEAQLSQKTQYHEFPAPPGFPPLADSQSSISKPPPSQQQQQQPNELSGPPGFPPLPPRFIEFFQPQPDRPREQQYNNFPGPSGFSPLPTSRSQHFQQPSQAPHEQELNDLSRPPGFPPLPTLHDAMVDIAPSATTVTTRRAVNTATTVVLVCDDDEAVAMAARSERKPADPEPQTPPTNNLLMRIVMFEQANVQARVNESSPPLSPSFCTLLSSVASAGSSSSTSHVISSFIGEAAEGGVLKIPLPPHTAANVAKTERKLFQARLQSFQSSVRWTEAVLTEILTYELEKKCVKSATRLDRLRRQEQLDDCEAQQWAQVTVAEPWDANQQQQQKRFDCFNTNQKPPPQLIYFIERLVYGANCSFSVFIVMLMFIDRLQQRCKYLQLTHLNVQKVVLAALLAAVKFVDDTVYSSTHYASISGVDVKELNHLQFTFNQATDWTFFVTTDGYKAYENGLLEQWTSMNVRGELVVLSPGPHGNVC